MLRLFTASDVFDAEVSFEPGSSRFEPGVTPAETVTLAWESFSDAAEESGISRLYGGIHFEDGDVNGQALGREAGEASFREAMRFIAGGDDADTGLAIPEALAVGRLYEGLLGRIADVGGLNFWIGAGDRLDAAGLAEAFLVSGEYAALAGGEPSGAALVDTLFLNLGLDAEATDADEDLLARLDAGESAAAVVADFLAGDLAADATTYLAALETGEDGQIWFA